MTRKIVYLDAGKSSARFLCGSRLAKLESSGEFEVFYEDRPDDDV